MSPSSLPPLVCILLSHAPSPMEEVLNPYAAPKADLHRPANYETDDCWRQGKILIVRAGRPLPCRCLKCNEAAVTPIKPRKLYWHPPGWYILILAGLLPYALAALAIRRKATIYPGLCAVHTRRRNLITATAALLFFGSIALFVLAGVYEFPVAAAVGGICLLLSIPFALLSAHRIYPTRIDDRFIQIKGAGRPFLESLPSL